MLRLLRQFAFPDQPIVDAARTGIVRSSSQTEIAELRHKIAQQPCRGSDSLQRVERIVETHGLRRLRHELRDPLCAGVAHHVGPETAFLQQQADEEGNRQRIRLGGLHERVEISRLERSTTGFAAAAGGRDCSAAFVEAAAAVAGVSLLVSSLRTAPVPKIASAQRQTNKGKLRMSSSRNADARADTHRRKY